MAIDLSTAGTKVYYAVEKTAGTRPTAAADYVQIKGLKSIPEMNPEPESLETTELEETEYKTYINGLKDLGGALTFTMNLRNDTKKGWKDMYGKYKTGIETGLETWFCIVNPGLDEDLFFTGEPAPLGMPGMEVNSVLESNVYITPTNAPDWYEKLEV
jgi:hypothetical protein